MNQTIIGGKNSEYNRQLHEAREARLTKIEVYEEEIKMLRQMVFSMIKGGTNNG